MAVRKENDSKEIKRLRLENLDLAERLEGANQTIDAIRRGNIDAVIIGDEKKQLIYIPYNADKSYKTFTEQLPEGVVALYPDGVILYSNLCFTETICMDLHKVLGQRLIDFIAPESKRTFKALLKKVKVKDCSGEIYVVNGKGEKGPFLISLKSLQLEEHLTISVVLTDLRMVKEQEAKLILSNERLEESIAIQNLAQQKTRIIAHQLKEKLKQLKTVNARLEAFAYITSHHLQEPLRKIRTFGGLLKNRYYITLDNTGQNYIERIESSSIRMQKMISDILTYSQLAGEVNFENCNLNLMLKNVLSDLEIKVKETKAKIIVNSTLSTIEANSNQIQQLLLNIIDNSLKFHKADEVPSITITSEIIDGKEINDIQDGRRDEKFCKIEIKDKGIGFSNEFSQQIFLLFKRLHPEPDYPGTGLGLAICEKVVDNHKGFISAESELGKGTLITVFLPVDQTTTDQAVTEPLKIMIADDDPDDRNLMELAFEEIHSPVELEFVPDGEILLNDLNEKVRKGQELPDLVLLDLNMPKKDGRVALKEIKSDQYLQKLNVIVFSTSSAPSDIKLVMNLGAHDYLTKPSDYNNMVDLFTKIYKYALKVKLERNK